MTVQPEDWTEEEYCAFYQQSTTCSESSVASYSCVPSCLSDCSDVFCDSMSTLVFACDDSVHATYKNKSAVETSCLNSFAANSPTRTQMSFTAQTEFGGVSPSEMDTGAGRQVAIAAMTLAMSGVTADQVTIKSITGTESRRRSSNKNMIAKSYMRNGVVAQAATSNVLYEITVVVELLGYSSSSYTAAYDQLVGEISASFSGQFQQNLKAAGQTAGVTTFQSADVSKIPTYGSPEVTQLVTVAPTPAPSFSPTSFKNKSSGSDDDANAGAIAGGVIGGFVILLLIFCFIYFCLNRQRRAEMEEKFKKQMYHSNGEASSLRFGSPSSSDQPGAFEEKSSESSQSGGGKLGGKAAEQKPAFLNEDSDTNNFL
jgi:hypothetical protein